MTNPQNGKIIILGGERNVLWDTVAAGTIAESLFSLSSPVPGEGNEGGEVPDL